MPVELQKKKAFWFADGIWEEKNTVPELFFHRNKDNVVSLKPEKLSFPDKEYQKSFENDSHEFG